VTSAFKHFNLTKTWAGLLCLALASFAMHGCAGDSAASYADNGGKGGGRGKGGRGRGDSGPAPVMVTQVVRKDVPIDINVVGNVEAYATINVVPQVGGQLMDVYFTEGDYVKKGQKLFSMDSRPLEAQLQQIEANLARDKALLAQGEANLARDSASEAYARQEAGRYMSLFDQGIVSKEQGDQYQTNANTLAQSVLADKAAIDSSKAQMLADQAQIENAKVQLSYTTIDSPLDGRTGNLSLKRGNVVTANSTNLITVNQIEPIYVTFSVPESYLSDVRRYTEEGKLMVMAKTQDANAQQERGELTFIDNNVDTTTGTVKLKGTFPNTGRKLWPGQYVNVTLRLAMQANALVLPNQAVQSGQDGTFVYVVKEDRTVEARPVVTGARIDQDLVIQKGLEAGETVVTEGQLRLSPGALVQIGGDGQGPGGDKQGRRRGKNPT
jgi:multidrug efflux system membrane fusion protein